MDVALDPLFEGLSPGRRLRTMTGKPVQIESPIGAGNEGVVFRANLHGVPVALKLFKPDRTGRRVLRTRALIKQDLAHRLAPQIAGPYEELEWEGRVGHVAPLARGISVQELIDHPEALSPRQRVVATIKLGALLLRLHRSGLAFGDLNKGAVKVQVFGLQAVEVSLVDLDSVVMPGITPPLTLGTPDTSAPELRQGQQPQSLSAWQAADWTAFGHVALELLLAKTAACGIEEPLAQVNAFLDVPQCFRNTPQGRAVDKAAGLSVNILPPEVLQPLARLFEKQPQFRDGAAVVRALTSEVINNHQVTCQRCGMQYFVHMLRTNCPSCACSVDSTYSACLPDGTLMPLSNTGLPLTRALLGNAKVQQLHARLFTMGGMAFICAYSSTHILRRGVRLLLPLALHVPLMRFDRVRLTESVEILIR